MNEDDESNAIDVSEATNVDNVRLITLNFTHCAKIATRHEHKHDGTCEESSAADSTWHCFVLYRSRSGSRISDRGTITIVPLDTPIALVVEVARRDQVL